MPTIPNWEVTIHAVKQEDNPGQETIDALHAQYVAALLKLFDNHKHLIPGFEKKQLRVV